MSLNFLAKCTTQRVKHWVCNFTSFELNRQTCNTCKHISLWNGSEIGVFYIRASSVECESKRTSYTGFRPIFYCKHGSGYSTVLTSTLWKILSLGDSAFLLNTLAAGSRTYSPWGLCRLGLHLGLLSPTRHSHLPTFCSTHHFYPCTGFRPIFYCKHGLGYSTVNQICDLQYFACIWSLLVHDF